MSSTIPLSCPHELSVSLCLFLCERTCLSARKGYKDTSEVRGNAHATISWSLSVSLSLSLSDLTNITPGSCVCVFITAVPITKLFALGEGDRGGHVLRETTSRGLCGLVCPSRTSERGGEGDCVKEGGGGEGKCERERALERLRCYSPGH